jgi:hypothetical protein
MKNQPSRSRVVRVACLSRSRDILLVVCAIAGAASCLPVWRTLRIDPASILRDE